jgi:hypothetical protein
MTATTLILLVFIALVLYLGVQVYLASTGAPQAGSIAGGFNPRKG